MCEKGEKNMGIPAPKIYNFSGYNTNKKQNTNKPLAKLTQKEIKQSMDFKKRSWDRD